MQHVVYLFSESGAYLGIYGETDENGMVYFELPVNENFQFRVDYLGSQYWSDLTTISGGGTNSVSVDTGGGLFQVTVEKSPGSPLEGINVYLFSPSDSYLGLYQVTDMSGKPPTLKTKALVASNGRIHQKIFDVIHSKRKKPE